MNICDYKVLSFDCYGTLIDWETGIWDGFQPLLMANRCDQYTRQSLLQIYAKIESQQQLETPTLLYQDLLLLVHEKVAKALSLKTDDLLNQAFANSLTHWPAFADSADSLRLLQRDFKLAILSNVSDSGFALSNKKLGVDFDAIYTAEQVGCYKPNKNNFAYMLKHLEQDFSIQPQQVLHVAQSLFHDHVQANNFGLSTVWIDRQGLNDSDNWGATALVEQRPTVDFIFPDMHSFVATVETQKG